MNRETDPQPILQPGRNCWKIASADRVAVVIDAAEYFRLIREAMIAAKHRILLIGWEFDTRIEFNFEEGSDSQSLGDFLLHLAKENPEREIDILRWNFGSLKQLLNPVTAFTMLRWMATKSIKFHFDGAHPVGCSHHQKIAVIDSSFAVCGGIDLSAGRWDTPEHLDEQPLRILPDGNTYPPWHDVTMLLEGSAGEALSELGRQRWKAATQQDLSPIEGDDSLWPEHIEAMFEDVEIGISRTRAEFKGNEEIREIEALYLDMIVAANSFVYLENQYLTSGKIASAIAKRMEEKNPPEIVVVMPKTGDGWLEQKAMDGARAALVRMIGKSDTNKRFRIYTPVTHGGTDIYVHAKVSILDDRFLRVGSANMNNRSMGLDSECDVILDAALPKNRTQQIFDGIRNLRHRFIAEHLGIDAEDYAKHEEQCGSMIEAIESLRGKGKTLVPLELEDFDNLEEFIAENELLDPECADGFFEAIPERGLKKSWNKGLAMIRGSWKNET